MFNTPLPVYVWRSRIGQASAPHTRAMYGDGALPRLRSKTLTDSRLLFHFPDGSTRNAPLNKGQVIMAKPTTHQPENQASEPSEVKTRHARHDRSRPSCGSTVLSAERCDSACPAPGSLTTCTQHVTEVRGGGSTQRDSPKLQVLPAHHVAITFIRSRYN